MSRPASVQRSVEVAVDPATAFEAFTAEIDAWFQRGPHSWNDPKRAVGIRFEPRVGGRWLEVWDAASGEGYEIGRILVWEPGRRLVTTYRNVWLPPEPVTEIEVRFEGIPQGTRVTLEHRGLDRLPQDVAARLEERAWLALMSWFREHVARDKENRMTTQSSLQPPVRQALTPYLCCKGAARALEFYVKVFGGTELTRWTDPATGTIGHAEVRFADSVLMLADEHPEIGVLSPQSLGGSPVALHLYVADVDAVAREAVAAGGTLLRPVADQEYGERGCKLADPFGHVWMIATRKQDMSLAEIQKRVGSSYEVS